MKNFFFKFFFNTKKGYYNFVKSKKLSIVREIISSLHETDFIDSNEEFHNVKKSKLIRQFLGQKFLYQRFVWFFFYFQAKKREIIFPLPIKWSKKLNEKNIKVNLFLSYLLYLIFVIFQFLKGIVFLFYIVLKYVFYLLKKNLYKYDFNNSVIFYNISTKKINLDIRPKFNLYSWFIEKFDKNFNVIFLHNENKKKLHEKNLYETNDELELFFPYFNFFSFLKNLFQFLLEFRKISLLSYNSILFEENLKLIFFKSISKVDLKKIFIIWTSNIFKPLWIYELEKKGVDVVLFFNGFLNEIRLNKNLELDHDHEGLSNMTWKNYYTWDEINSDYLKKKVNFNFKTVEKGPIYFSDNNNEINLPDKTIAVFGYENHKRNIGINTISDYEFCSKNFLQIFYDDIIKVSKESGYKILIKRKTDLNNLEIKKNKEYFKKLHNNPDIIFVDPKISAFKVIKNCNFVISMPFTSTAKIGQFFNKNTIYYDPFSWIQSGDPSGSNIKLVQGKQDLIKYIKFLKYT